MFVAAALIGVVIDEHGDDIDPGFEIIGHFMQVDVAGSAVLVGARAESDETAVDEQLVGAVRTDPEIGFEFDQIADELLAHEEEAVRVVQQ